MRKLLPALLLMSCAHQTVADKDPVWVEDDKHPIEKPDGYWSGLYWDGADKMVFRPLSHFWKFEVKGPAKNVNVLEEVPNSSWYTNRLALKKMTPDEVAKGPCREEDRINIKGPIIVKSGKTDGANPGFNVKDPSTGKRYVLKFDGRSNQEARATAADVMGSKIYYAAGFEVPCNEVIYFNPSILKIADDATKKDSLGRKTPMTQQDVDTALEGVVAGPNGTIRGSASLFITGEPIGPFTYEGTRDDDPNDVIPHEDRRELRGSKLLAAWTNHFDAREQNTLTAFVRDGEGDDAKGYVQHYIIDWGDTLGSRWKSDLMSRKFGHAYYFDVSQVLGDLLTLGLIVRPWDKQKHYGVGGEIFGYFDAALFEPEKWKAGYPNTAFNYMDDNDAYWMTRIISRFSDAHIDALVEEVQLPDPRHRKYISSVLRDRRDKIVKVYFDRMSALDRVRFKGDTICWDDLVVVGGYGGVGDSFYKFRIGDGPWFEPDDVSATGVCHSFEPSEERFTVEVKVRRTYQQEFARSAKFTFRRGSETKLVKVER